MLELIALGLAGIHFGVPLGYYWYVKNNWLPRPWNIKTNEKYMPKVTIILPTYMEAKYIHAKLDNIENQDYPKDQIEVIIIDSGSNDGTVEIIEKWMSEHTDTRLKLIKEKKRKGKLSAILKSLNHTSPDTDIILFTDADAFWEQEALRKTVKYFADPSIGAVTSNITYSERTSENIYRKHYNVIRVAESKIHSTPVHNGPFLAIRAELIKKFGLPTFPGSDDSSFGSYIALIGFRAIQADDVNVKEPLRGNQLYRKIRRAQHLLLNFLKTKQYAKKHGVYKYTKNFERIWKIEWWLHIVNPWLLIACTILLLTGAYHGSITALTLLGAGLILLILKAYRTWLLQQLYLVTAAIRNLWTREITWSR